jgi:hypothetical protein
VFTLKRSNTSFVSDIRILNNKVSAAIMEDALTSHIDQIHIFSNSYTNYGDGVSIHHLHPEVESALQRGTTRVGY